MIRLDTIGIAIDAGIIPPVTKMKTKLSSIGIILDSGVVPPKNFFKSKISVVGVSGDILEESERTSILFYQIY